MSTAELYSALHLRAQVFVVEQNCAYLDPDNLDQHAYHLFCYTDDNQLVGYARLLPPGSHFAETAIGRVVSSPQHRQQGYGKAIMAEAIVQARQLFPQVNIRIMAQCYLIKFYQSFGFVVVSEEFLEDGIPHVEMVRNEF